MLKTVSIETPASEKVGSLFEDDDYTRCNEIQCNCFTWRKIV